MSGLPALLALFAPFALFAAGCSTVDIAPGSGIRAAGKIAAAENVAAAPGTAKVAAAEAAPAAARAVVLASAEAPADQTPDTTGGANAARDEDGLAPNIDDRVVPPEVPPALDAANSRRFNLEQLEALAEANSPTLRRDLARVDAARGRALQAGLYPNPNFDPGNPQLFGGRNTTAAFGFSQRIITNGKLRLDTAVAAQEVRAAELTYRQDRYELLTNVRQAYFAILIDRRRVETLTTLLKIAEASARTGLHLEQAAQASRIDTLLLEIDSRQVRADLRRAATDLDARRKRLAAIVAAPEVETADIIGDPTLGRPDFDEEIVRQYAVTASTLIQSARVEITRSRARLERAQAEPVPDFYAGPVYQAGVTPGSEAFGFNLVFPIPVWDRNQGNIRAASAGIVDAEQNLKTVQNDQLQRVADALGRYEGARRLAEEYEREILPRVEEATRRAREAYEQGLFDFPRYLQAQRTAVQTNLSYLEALDALWAAASDLAGLLQLERMPPGTGGEGQIPAPPAPAAEPAPLPADADRR